jgi:hypothetical protein
MLDFGFCFVFLLWVCLVNGAHQPFNIWRANRAAGGKGVKLKGIRAIYACRFRGESSQIVNSHHEKAKRGLIGGDLRGLLPLEVSSGLAIEPFTFALPVGTIDPYGKANS